MLARRRCCCDACSIRVKVTQACANIFDSFRFVSVGAAVVLRASSGSPALATGIVAADGYATLKTPGPGTYWIDVTPTSPFDVYGQSYTITECGNDAIQPEVAIPKSKLKAGYCCAPASSWSVVFPTTLYLTDALGTRAATPYYVGGKCVFRWCDMAPVGAVAPCGNSSAPYPAGETAVVYLLEISPGGAGIGILATRQWRVAKISPLVYDSIACGDPSPYCTAYPFAEFIQGLSSFGGEPDDFYVSIAMPSHARDPVGGGVVISA